MRGTSLNRAAIEEANKSDLIARATTDEINGGLHIVCKGLLVVTVWLLLASTPGLSQTSSSLSNLLAPDNSRHLHCGDKQQLAENDRWQRRR